MTIKHSIGKLTLRDSVQTIIENHTDILTLLPITMRHIEVLATLPLHHRDPFDRIMIAQALTENLTVVSSDAAFDMYGVTRVWEVGKGHYFDNDQHKKPVKFVLAGFCVFTA